MKVEYYATPDQLKNTHTFGVRLLDNDNIQDYGTLGIRDYANLRFNILPQLRKAYGPLDSSVIINATRGDTLGQQQAIKYRNLLKDAIDSGNFNELFGIKDPEPKGFMPMTDENGVALVNEQGKKVFRPIFGNYNQDLYNLGSDFWKRTKEDWDADEEKGLAHLKGRDIWDNKSDAWTDKVNKRESDYISKIFDEGAMSEEERRAFIASITDNDLLKSTLESRLKLNRWVKDDDGTVTVDLNTGRGSGTHYPKQKVRVKIRPGTGQHYTVPTKTAKEVQKAIDEDIEANPLTQKQYDDARHSQHIHNLTRLNKEPVDRSEKPSKIRQDARSFVNGMFNEKYAPEQVKRLADMGLTKEDIPAMRSYFMGSSNAINEGKVSPYQEKGFHKITDKGERAMAMAADYLANNPQLKSSVINALANPDRLE